MQTERLDAPKIIARLIGRGANLHGKYVSANLVRSGGSPLELELEPLAIENVAPEYSKDGPLTGKFSFEGREYNLGVCDHVGRVYDALYEVLTSNIGRLPSGVVIKSSVLHSSEKEELGDLLLKGRLTGLVAFSSEGLNHQYTLPESLRKKIYRA